MTRQVRHSRRAASVIVVLAAAVLSACGAGDQHASAIPAQASRSGARTRAVASASAAARDRAVPRPRNPVIPAGRTIRSFSGSGNDTIGSLSEKTAIVLQWSTSAARFQLFTAQGFLLLDSRARTGRVRLAPGDYSGLHVASPDRWTLLLRASA